jgi:hypothetical protein
MWDYKGPAMAEVACASDANAITCWQTGTHHGFKLSADVAVYW